MTDVILRMENISKSFPGVKALDGVTIEVRRGSVHALMGENGAGKSTLMKCLFGVYEKDVGRIFLDGESVDFKNSKEALLGGVAMVHQELNQAGKMTVAENLWLGRFPKYVKWLPFINERKMKSETKKALDEIGLDIDPDTKMDTLSVSKRQMAEIAKAVSYGAKVIVFDEPTSSLNGDEAERLFETIRALKKKGCGIIYISHKMEEILRISDEVTVMRDGRYIATKDSKNVTTDEIIRLMVGRELTDRYPKSLHAPEDTLFSVENLCGSGTPLRDISFTLKRGEVLGVAGLDGSGRTELLESIFGLSSLESGSLMLNGNRIVNDSPRAAIKNGFALVTEERRSSGIFGILPIVENTVISSLKKHKRFGLLSKRKMTASANEYVKKLRTKTPSVSTKIQTLSGGNQQKVIFSRWMLTEPTVLLLDEPTRGIDVGAKFEIYELIRALASDGRGVIMVSSEMPELIGMCERILVMSGGRLAGIVERGASEESIMALATKYV